MTCICCGTEINAETCGQMLNDFHWLCEVCADDQLEIDDEEPDDAE